MYQTPDVSIVDSSVGPTPKTKRLNELTVEVRNLLAKLGTQTYEIDDAHDELIQAKEEFSKIPWFKKNRHVFNSLVLLVRSRKGQAFETNRRFTESGVGGWRQQFHRP